MKLLIATPAFGGMVTLDYMHSLMATVERLRVEKIYFEIITLKNESLVTRARNTCASYALRGGFTDLFFLDADLSWRPEHFLKVLRSDAPLCGGTYPVKDYPIRMNFNPLSEDLESVGRKEGRDIETLWRLKKSCAKDNGELKVNHVPTGFMRIKREVLQKFSESPYIQEYTKDGQTHWDFFKAGPRGDTYLSEDWFFCEHAEHEGFSVTLQTEAICEHTGTHTFRS